MMCLIAVTSQLRDPIFSYTITRFLFQIPFLSQRLLFTLAQQPAKSIFKGNRVD